jgi:hypothetical protein
MVFLALNRRRMEACCCKRLVLKGAFAPSDRSFSSTESTRQAAEAKPTRIVSASSPLWISAFFPSIFLRSALNRDETHRHRLHPAGGKTLGDLFPKERGELVSHEPIEDPAGLLGVHQVHVDLARFLERALHRPLRDFIEGDARHPVFSQPEAVLEVIGDGFPLPVGVRGQVDLLGAFDRFAELREGLLPVGQDGVFRLKALVDIDPQRVAGKVRHMPHRRLHGVLRAQVSPQRPRLGGRFHDDHEIDHG